MRGQLAQTTYFLFATHRFKALNHARKLVKAMRHLCVQISPAHWYISCYMYVYVHICVYIYIYTYSIIHYYIMCIHTYMFYIYIYMYIYIYIYVHYYIQLYYEQCDVLPGVSKRWCLNPPLAFCLHGRIVRLMCEVAVDHLGPFVFHGGAPIAQFY